MKRNAPLLILTILFLLVAGTSYAQLNCSGGWCPPFSISSAAVTIAATYNLTFPATSAGIVAYNTADQTTNYERVLRQYASNVFIIRSEKAGAGTTRRAIYIDQGVSGGRLEVQSESLPYVRASVPSVNSTGTPLINFGVLSGSGSSNASGTAIFMSVAPTINSSGTGANTDFLINRTQTAVGSGAQYLFEAQVGGVPQFAVTNAGAVQMSARTVLLPGLPTCSGAGCVVGATSTNSSLNFTTTTTGASDITITFSASFTNAPSCFATNETTGNLSRVTTSTVSSIHVQGVTVSGDTIRVGCFGN